LVLGFGGNALKTLGLRIDVTAGVAGFVNAAGVVVHGEFAASQFLVASPGTARAIHDRAVHGTAGLTFALAAGITIRAYQSIAALGSLRKRSTGAAYSLQGAGKALPFACRVATESLDAKAALALARSAAGLTVLALGFALPDSFPFWNMTVIAFFGAVGVHLARWVYDHAYVQLGRTAVGSVVKSGRGDHQFVTHIAVPGHEGTIHGEFDRLRVIRCDLLGKHGLGGQPATRGQGDGVQKFACARVLDDQIAVLHVGAEVQHV